jgi:capsular polysaccharide export protein
LLRDCRAVVTINSTVGPLALQHGKPVFVLADAVYRRPGLTHGGSLASFWTAPQPVVQSTYAEFVDELMTTNQINGGFHSPNGLALLVRHSVAAIQNCNGR